MNISNNIQQAAHIIRRGGLVAFPTETVYGLGADALNAEAVARIFAVKRRPRFDPLIVHVADRMQAEGITGEFPGIARKLADAFWPGPLTLVLPKRVHVPGIVTAGLPTVAIRFPDHPMARKLIESAGTPIAAPSANLFGRISPTRFEHVVEQLGDRVDLVLEGPPCRVGVESTIIGLYRGQPCLLRPGGVSLEELESVTGPLQLSPENDDVPESPGRLKQHYSPVTPLRQATPDLPSPPAGRRWGLLSFSGSGSGGAGFAVREVLSPEGELREAAANLFEALHRLDSMHLDLIVAEILPNNGLGVAINDRLKRAAQNDKPLESGHAHRS